MAERSLLLINLGSPQAPTSPALKTYLNEFLTDKYVIDLPAPVRQILVRTLITPFRAHKSAEAFAKIWTEKGSPLVHFTREFADGVTATLQGWDVRWAMRYGSPSVSEVLKGWNPKNLHVVPLYPQYAESSTRTAIEKIKMESGRSGIVSFKYLQDFFTEPEFIAAEVRQIASEIARFKPDHLLMSFHGLPEHHMSKLHPEHCFKPGCCDTIGAPNRLCYRAQCFATARAIQAHVKFPDFTVTFQSRLGRRPWIKPYTDHVIRDLAKQGAKRVLVASPSFVADCLETLEEIQMRLKDQFISEGGEALQLVPALNAGPDWIKGFCTMIQHPRLEWRSIAVSDV
jgi:ferrochelatase